MRSKTISIGKTITWRLTASTTTAALIFLYGGELKVAGAVAGSEIFIKMLFYYFHERAWEKATVKVDPEYNI